MKNVLMFLTIILFLFLNGCKKERQYVYPQPKRLELERICEFIKARGTNRFMVLLGKIYPLNNDGDTMPIENLHTKLNDAGYFCGNSNFKDLHCNKIFVENNIKNNCNY
tara:strand:+ start:100 stop:426 length:327 start_codon:yes stop_codon:yes gene_type:complete